MIQQQNELLHETLKPSSNVLTLVAQKEIRNLLADLVQALIGSENKKTSNQIHSASQFGNNSAKSLDKVNAIKLGYAKKRGLKRKQTPKLSKGALGEKRVRRLSAQKAPVFTNTTTSCFEQFLNPDKERTNSANINENNDNSPAKTLQQGSYLFGRNVCKASPAQPYLQNSLDSYDPQSTVSDSRQSHNTNPLTNFFHFSKLTPTKLKKGPNSLARKTSRGFRSCLKGKQKTKAIFPAADITADARTEKESRQQCLQGIVVDEKKIEELAFNSNTNATTSLPWVVSDKDRGFSLIQSRFEASDLQSLRKRDAVTNAAHPTSVDVHRASLGRKQDSKSGVLPSSQQPRKQVDSLRTSQPCCQNRNAFSKTKFLRQNRGPEKGPASTGRPQFEQRDESSLDQEIAASVRCLCKISSGVNGCIVCRFESSFASKNKDSPSEEIDARASVFINRRQQSHDEKAFLRYKQKLKDSYYQQSAESFQSYSNNHRALRGHHQEEEQQRLLTKSKAFGDPFWVLGFPSSLPAGSVLNHLLNAAPAASAHHRKLGIITFEQSDMGCFHSVSNKSKVGPCRTNIHSDVQATIDQTPTIIEEYSPIVLRYRTPYFRANAQVVMPPIRRKETWTVGWIQACDHMKFINQYGNLGCSSWEIPALKSGLIPAVSDSDGVSYPWYGNTTEIATIVGPTETYKSMNLTMNDNFYPSVTWDIPVSEGTNAHLTRIVRDQSFVTWLAAINETSKEIIVLKTVRWKFYLEIDVDPTRELGSRARIVAPRIQKQPLITNGPCERSFFHSPMKNRRKGTDNNSNSNFVGQIPISALVRPSANNAQTLIWRPADSNPIIVVPAKEEHKETNELILFNGCSAMLGKESIVKEISKQEMLQLQEMAR